MAKRGRTLGSVLFQRAPGTQREKARRCHVNESTASRWCSGDTTPSDYQTRILAQRATGVPPDLWDKPYSADALRAFLTAHPELARMQVQQPS